MLKKIVKNCDYIVLDKNVVPVFIPEINCKLRYREFIKFSFASGIANFFIYSNIINCYNLGIMIS